MTEKLVSKQPQVSGYNICRHFASLGMVAFAVEYRPEIKTGNTKPKRLPMQNQLSRWI